MSGEIPEELGSLSNLQVLYLSGNQLSGCIPEALSDVGDNDYSDLGLSFCPSTITPVPSDITPVPSDEPDRAALTALYNVAGGPEWSRNNNWLSAPQSVSGTA